jgi:hypothetical protein
MIFWRPAVSWRLGVTDSASDKSAGRLISKFILLVEACFRLPYFHNRKEHMKTIRSEDHKQIITELDVLVDVKEKAIGLMGTDRGQSFIIPLPFDSAYELAEYLLKTLIAASPNMFFGKKH